MSKSSAWKRFRYRLSTLMALMLIIAITAAAYGNRLRAQQRQDEAFRQIAAKGGYILHGTGGTSVEFKSPDGFICGTGLIAVFKPEGDAASFGDSDVELFDRILNLYYVSFAGSAVTENRIRQFQVSHSQCSVKTLADEL